MKTRAFLDDLTYGRLDDIIKMLKSNAYLQSQRMKRFALHLFLRLYIGEFASTLKRFEGSALMERLWIALVIVC